ncbi:hypothetical protein ACWDYH_17870 [Nocardia goodfellowii]
MSGAGATGPQVNEGGEVVDESVWTVLCRNISTAFDSSGGCPQLRRSISEMNPDVMNAETSPAD